MKHEHYWFYEHTVWEGRKANEVGVVRYCECGLIQMAFASNWGKVPKSHPDALAVASKGVSGLLVPPSGGEPAKRVSSSESP